MNNQVVVPLLVALSFFPLMVHAKGISAGSFDMDPLDIDGSYSAQETFNLPPIDVSVPYGGPHGNPKGEPSGDEIKKSQAKAEEAAKQAALAKATEEEKLRVKEAKDAAYELLLRLGDESLENDGNIVEKVWDALTDEFISPGVSQILKSLTPAKVGKSWIDLAETKKEMLGARYLMQKEADDAKKAEQLKSENEKTLGLSPSDVKTKENNPEQERFFKAVRGLASARSDDTGFVVDQLISRGQKTSENPISLSTIKAIVKKLAPLTPPNACAIPPGKWSCPMGQGSIGGACGCPGIGNGVGALRPLSEYCSGAIANCRLSVDLPVGTPCNCNADFQQIKGPIPWGRIVKRP
ncbi:hypothetical protein HX857_16985 [Pseudomonas gingeri]|uniref:hypothetical protein n=1 Tax=Pseudomonas gingeri TaxID=117681 RepID=UPI0015B97017|nr:hypothetical protein [Pseudomonas gingeri]NWE70395.1 hypothetical protein [Pseudomonas gingeri]